VLILGGTAEAVELAGRLVDDARVVTSLAGRTKAPRRPPGELRVGSFGGVVGLSLWLKAQRVRALIDATHPFAQRISANAIDAATERDVPLLRLERPPWRPLPDDDWRTVDDLAEAVAMLPRGARVFAAVGRQELAAFAGRPDLSLLVRTVDAQPALPVAATAVVGRGPFDLEAESALLRDHGIGWIVCKNAGGSGAEAKLWAARALGVPVVMVRRPVLPPVETVTSVEDARAWLAARDI
jgi:precorrin-6A/cobalt-precorrin-6A reductase